MVDIGDWFKSRYQKTIEKIQHEQNPKLVSFKVRSFIEKLRDLLQRYEPLAHSDIPPSKQSQLDRIEKSIAELQGSIGKMSAG